MQTQLLLKALKPTLARLDGQVLDVGRMLAPVRWPIRYKYLVALLR
jgi:hypothetical protein